MTVHPITLNLPETIYKQVQLVAKNAHRPVNDILLEAVAAIAPVLDSSDNRFKSALAQLSLLNDAALWQAARSMMPVEQRERLESLHDKQQQDGLTEDEKLEEEALLKMYRETILVRAQAAVLLKQRKYNVVDSSQFQSVV